MKEFYDSLDNDNNTIQRVTCSHPAIGQYVVRASGLWKTLEQAKLCCQWLNAMVYRRTGTVDRFKVVIFIVRRGVNKPYAVVRKLAEGDLAESISQGLVERKCRI